MSRRPTLQQAVEEKAGQCRGLAMAMRSHAEALGFWKGFERNVIDGWASSLDAIAEGLTEAIHEKDMGRLRRFMGYAGMAALLVLQPAVEGVSSGLAQAAADEQILADDRISTCARLVLSDLEELSFLSWMVEPAATGVEAVSSAVAGRASGTAQGLDATARPDTVTAKAEAPTPAITGSGAMQTEPATASGDGTSAGEPRSIVREAGQTSVDDSQSIVIPPAELKLDGVPPVLQGDPKPADHVLEVDNITVQSRIDSVELEQHGPDDGSG